MNELDMVERIRRKAAGTRPRRLLAGIGDDCAVWRPRPGQDLLFTTDLSIENVHFRASTHPPEAVGWKALARGLSDIAAMGGEPRFCLLSLALAPWCDDRWVDRFFRGLLRLARSTGAPLVGGDLARTERVTCDIVVCGAVSEGRALGRNGARPGDTLWVSGKLGGSALGLATRRGAAWKRHLKPEPRLALGRLLSGKLRATAAIDLSDGLSIDLDRLCRASRVAAVIDRSLPVWPGASLDQALHGGEDYELLFTLPPGVEAPRSRLGVPLTRIGSIRKGLPGRVTLAGEPLAPLGWDHFRHPVET